MIVNVKTSVDTVAVTTKCPKCNEYSEVVVDRKEWALWNSGLLPQNALVSLSADDREKLISGICPKCWDQGMERELMFMEMKGDRAD